MELLTFCVAVFIVARWENRRRSPLTLLNRRRSPLTLLNRRRGSKGSYLAHRGGRLFVKGREEPFDRHGFKEGYDRWIWHGESLIPSTSASKETQLDSETQADCET
nr:uncharacterized protein LOC109154146 [Ipomoea batatas]